MFLLRVLACASVPMYIDICTSALTPGHGTQVQESLAEWWRRMEKEREVLIYGLVFFYV